MTDKGLLFHAGIHDESDLGRFKDFLAAGWLTNNITMVSIYMFSLIWNSEYIIAHHDARYK